MREEQRILEKNAGAAGLGGQKTGSRKPPMKDSKVDFPEPEGPITVSTAPGAMSAERSIRLRRSRRMRMLERARPVAGCR
jgi:hypothetical protein